MKNPLSDYKSYGIQNNLLFKEGETAWSCVSIFIQNNLLELRIKKSFWKKNHHRLRNLQFDFSSFQFFTAISNFSVSFLKLKISLIQDGCFAYHRCYFLYFIIGVSFFMEGFKKKSIKFFLKNGKQLGVV